VGKKGFTLFELIIGMGISVILVVIVTTFLLLSQRSFLIEQGRAQLIVEARTSLDEMTRKTKEADNVLPTYNSPTNDNYESDGDTVILELPAVDGSGNLVSGSDVVVFEKQGENLIFLQFPAVTSSRTSLTKSLTQKISAYTVTYLDESGNTLLGNFSNTKTLNFSLTLSDTIRQKQIETSGEEDATLRNK
jgi:prepilin-type N-terminal cleavage/methylation domain-containing protein